MRRRGMSHHSMAMRLACVLLLAGAGCAPALEQAPRAAGALTGGTSAVAATVHVVALGSGIAHVTVRDPRGPWQIHVVEIDASRCRPRLEARKPGGRLSARAPASLLAAHHPAAAAVLNADFFRDPGGTPVGAHVQGGVPLIGPTSWPVFAVAADGTWQEGRARLEGHARVAADSARIAQVNRPAIPFSAFPGTSDGITLFTARADSIPADSAAARMLLRLIGGDERAGRALALRVDGSAPATLPAGDTVVMFAHGSARGWIMRRAPGDTVAWSASVRLEDGTDVAEAVGGFPALLRNGEDVLATQAVREEFGMRRHPRTAIGWTADRGRLFLVVVDGRQPPYSDGMTLPELTWLFRRLGAAYALNLDGGGSTTLVVRGDVVNRPSDGGAERAVGNALALTGCR
jgi:large repetitive protein